MDDFSRWLKATFAPLGGQLRIGPVLNPAMLTREQVETLVVHLANVAHRLPTLEQRLGLPPVEDLK